MSDKNAIRQLMLARRAELSLAERDNACGYLCEKLASVALPEPAIFAAYHPIRNEININQYVEKCAGMGFPVSMPSITHPELIMKFIEWVPGEPMKAGAYGIMEPSGGGMIVPNVILVPLVAFDRRGYRLGYGAGYYDATIAHLKHTNPSLLTIGVGYSFQEVERLPNEAHDERLSLVVTDKEVIRPV